MTTTTSFGPDTDLAGAPTPPRWTWQTVLNLYLTWQGLLSGQANWGIG